MILVRANFIYLGQLTPLRLPFLWLGIYLFGRSGWFKGEISSLMQKLPPSLRGSLDGCAFVIYWGAKKLVGALG